MNRLAWYWITCGALLVVGFGMPATASASLPSNDDLANAQRVTLGDSFTADTTGASLQSGEPVAPFYGPIAGPTVWYEWDAPAEHDYVQLVATNISFPNNDACVNVWDAGLSPPAYAFDSLGGPDNANGDCTHAQNFVSHPGHTYFFQVGSETAASVGRVTIDLTGFQLVADIQLTQTATPAVQVGQTIVIKSSVTNAGPQPTSVDLSIGRSSEMQLLSISGATCDDPLCQTANIPLVYSGPVVVTTLWRPFAPGPNVGIDVQATPREADDPTAAEATSSTDVTLPKGAVEVLRQDSGFNFVTTRHSASAGHIWLWWNAGPSGGTITDNTGLGLFDLPVDPNQGTSFTFFAAGKYQVVDSATGEVMTANVPITAGPATGSLTTVYSINWATRSAPAGLTYEIDLQRPNGVYVPWLTTTARGATFIADDGIGTYRVRARMVKADDDSTGTGWVTKKIVVN